MTREDLLSRLKAKFGDAIEVLDIPPGPWPVLKLSLNQARNIAFFLRNDPELEEIACHLPQWPREDARAGGRVPPFAVDGLALARSTLLTRCPTAALRKRAQCRHRSDSQQAVLLSAPCF